MTRPLARTLLGAPSVRWAVIGVWLSTQMGCLALEDEPYYGDQPVAVNRPPTILEGLVQPRGHRVELGTAAGCPINFSVRVEDANVDDAVTVRWYIDYDPDTNPQPIGRVFTFTNTGTPIRGETATFPITRMDSPGNPLAVPGEHLVEALVADGPFTNRDPDDGSNVSVPTYPTYVWLVTTRETTVDCEQ